MEGQEKNPMKNNFSSLIHLYLSSAGRRTELFGGSAPWHMTKQDKIYGTEESLREVQFSITAICNLHLLFTGFK